MSSWIRTLGTDSLVYGLGYGLTRFLQIVILPIIAQSLSLSEFGYYSNYVIFYTVVSGFLVFGLDSAVARYYFESDKKDYHQRLFSTAIAFIAVLTAITILGFSIYSDHLQQLIGVPEAYGTAFFYILMCIPACTINAFLLSWFKWKREKLKFLINSGGTIVLLLIPLVVSTEISFLFIFKVIFFSQLAVALISIAMSFDYLKPKWSTPLLITLLKYAFPWLLVYSFGVSRTYLDRVFLLDFLNDDSYGLYNFSIRIASILSVIIAAFDMSFGPLAFSIWNKPTAPIFFARLQSAYTLGISVIACAICICSPVLIMLLGGQKYSGAEQILPLLLFAAIPLSLINFSSLGASYAKKSFISTACLFFGFAIVLVLNLILTARYLQYGAAASSIAGHLAIVILGYFLSRRYYKIPFRYTKDAVIFFLFLSASLVSINVHFTGSVTIDILLKLIALLIIGALSSLLIYPADSRKLLGKIRQRFKRKTHPTLPL